VTRTNMFAAAEAALPSQILTIAPMEGIRLGSGDRRQFSTSIRRGRIGYTPCSVSTFYLIEFSLFRADKIRTPLLMMHNDQDGAVPWYQGGIEYSAQLKRLGKPSG